MSPPAGGDGGSRRRRESALERLKKALAEREIPAPQLEGYPLRKARKILRLAGIGPERLRLRLVDHPEERGMVVGQRPSPGKSIDLEDPNQRIELRIADRSSIGFLPHIYQRSDLSGRNFVRDFLWVFQHIQHQINDKLDNLEQYFDAYEAPANFLEYLASWVALTIENDWPENKKRSIIKKAVELYHLRGTPRGLRVYLRIFTGVDPVIFENTWPYEGFVIGSSSTVGLDTVLMHEVNPVHTFVVHIPLPIDQVDNPTILKIHRIIEHEKPVHTDYYLTFAEPEEVELDTGITVGVQSTIGVDTWLEGGDAEFFDPLGGDEFGSMTLSDEG